MTTYLILEDLPDVPPSIRQFIGVEHFGAVMRRRQRLSDIIRQVVNGVPGVTFEHVSSNQELEAFIDRIQSEPESTRIFRLPSSLMPTDTPLFSALVQKAPFATDPAVYGDLAADKAPALFFRDDALAFWRARHEEARRVFVNDFDRRAIRVPNICRFANLRDARGFLSFMTGATEARFFNDSRVEAGIFHKSSHDIAKMRGEYLFFHVVDERMKRFLQPTFDYREDQHSASYSMENLSIPDAALQLIHHTFDRTSFSKLLDCFFDFIDSRTTHDVSSDVVRARGMTDIVGKLNRRIADLKSCSEGPHLIQLLTSACPYGDLDTLVSKCESILADCLAEENCKVLAVSHGDPCLSNILFSRDLGLFRLVDPRGAETATDALMHPYYDIAKFCHSVLSNYDFVNSGLFECRIDDRLMLQLELDAHGAPDWMRSMLLDRLARERYDLRLLRAIEASLFLSMLPLHVNTPRKLPAFCVIAGKLIDELEAER